MGYPLLVQMEGFGFDPIAHFCLPSRLRKKRGDQNTGRRKATPLLFASPFESLPCFDQLKGRSMSAPLIGAAIVLIEPNELIVHFLHDHISDDARFFGVAEESVIQDAVLKQYPSIIVFLQPFGHCTNFTPTDNAEYRGSIEPAVLSLICRRGKRGEY